MTALSLFRSSNLVKKRMAGLSRREAPPLLEAHPPSHVAARVSLGLLFGATFLYLAFRNVPCPELGDALRSVRWRWLCLALVVGFAIQIFRAWRWQLELRPLAHVPFGRLWIVTSVAYMAINLLPARIGEVVRPWLLSRHSSVTFANVIGNLMIEKTVDSVVILFYVLVSLITTHNLPDWVRTGARIPATLGTVLVVLVILFWWQGEAFVDRWVVRHLPARVATLLKRSLRSVLDGMRILPSVRLLLAVTAVSLALWFLPILSSYIMLRAFAFAVPFNAALIVFVFVGFGTALPNPPGMIGTYQYACVLALGLFDIPQAQALAYGLLLNAVQLFTLVTQGLVALPLAGVSIGDLRRPEQPPT